DTVTKFKKSSDRGTGDAPSCEPAGAAVYNGGQEPPLILDRRIWKSFSSAGLLLGTLLAAFSLTPSLLPRSALMQGILAGLSLAAGYAIGCVFDLTWRYLELPVPPARTARIVRLAAGVVCLAIGVVFLLRAPEWQNSIRVLMDMPPVEGTRPFAIALVALSLFAAVVIVARLF